MTRPTLKLSSLQESLLVELYEVQRHWRLTRDTWSFNTTVWSKASYTLGKRAGKLRPSPAKGRSNLERKYELRLKTARERLMKLGLAEWASVAGPHEPAKYAQGYKRHQVRGRDLFLTELGMTRAELALQRAGRMAADEASCVDTPEPSGPIAGDGLAGCED